MTVFVNPAQAVALNAMRQAATLFQLVTEPDGSLTVIAPDGRTWSITHEGRTRTLERTG